MPLNKFSIQKSFASFGKTYTLGRRYINAILEFDFFRQIFSKIFWSRIPLCVKNEVKAILNSICV